MSLSCSPVLERHEVERRLVEWLESSESSTFVIDHYDVMADGYWNFLVSNHNNELIIQGKEYPIPEGHQWVLIKSGSQTRDHVDHGIVNDVPSVTFEDYPQSDVVEIVTTLGSDTDIHDWCVDVYDIFKMF